MSATCWETSTCHVQHDRPFRNTASTEVKAKRSVRSTVGTTISAPTAPRPARSSTIEYDRLIAEWLASGRASTYGTPADDTTVVEVVAGYLSFAKQYYGDGKRGTYANMKRSVQPLKKLYARTPASEFGVLQFKAIRQTLIDEDLSRPYGLSARRGFGRNKPTTSSNCRHRIPTGNQISNC